MNKIFEDEFNEMLEVYMDEMIIKSNEEQLYKGYITSVFIVSNNITWDLIQRSAHSTLEPTNLLDSI